jgi:hypothetical protein
MERTGEKIGRIAEYLSPDIPPGMPEYAMGAPMIRDYQEVLP